MGEGIALGQKPVLFLGVSGEGLAHCTRALALSERLNADYDVHLFASGKAFSYLNRAGYPRVHRITGLHFSRQGTEVQYIPTVANFFHFFWDHGRELRRLERLASQLHPVGVLTDFEPLLPRLARRLSLPFISLDSQHRFSHCRVPHLSLPLRVYLWAVRFFVWLFIPKPDLTIVSSAHYDCLTPKSPETILTNVFLRRRFSQVLPTTEDFVLVYCKKFLQYRLLGILKSLPEKFKVYGALGPHGPNLEVKPLDNEEFIDDLARCKAVITTSGNQLLGEARYLGKPVLVIPEPGQWEQKVNGTLHEAMGLGVQCSLEKLTPAFVRRFLEHPPYVPRHPVNGCDVATKHVRSFFGLSPP